MQVLAKIDAVRLDVRIQLLEAGDLLRHSVPAVVDHDVDVRKARAHLAQETAVGLVADHHVDRIGLELATARIEVDADDARAAAEVMAPHFELAAVVDADLDHHRRAAAEGGEMAVIDLEVVVPLVDQPPGIVAEVFRQRVGGRPGAQHAQRVRQHAPQHYAFASC
jgi:hypothetical protein